MVLSYITSTFCNLTTPNRILRAYKGVTLGFRYTRICMIYCSSGTALAAMLRLAYHTVKLSQSYWMAVCLPLVVIWLGDVIVMLSLPGGYLSILHTHAHKHRERVWVKERWRARERERGRGRGREKEGETESEGERGRARARERRERWRARESKSCSKHCISLLHPPYNPSSRPRPR